MPRYHDFLVMGYDSTGHSISNVGDCNRYSEMSEVPPTVRYVDADGYNYYSLNTTCTQYSYLMLTLLDHALAITLHHIL